VDIGKKLKEKRQEANLTQKELAEILHVSRQTISSWEVGRTYPDLDVLVAISELYDTPLDDLLKEDSQMVKDITEKVRKSERRKITSMILGALLVVVIGISLLSAWERYQNNQANAYGLKPNDLMDSSWEMSFSPKQELMNSMLSFDSNSIMIRNQYGSMLLNPFINPEELEETNGDMRLDISTEHYENLTIEIIDNTYEVSGQGYQETFEKLSNSVIRDTGGTEYFRVANVSAHESLQYLSEREEEAREKVRE
jgi:transcriptional regulator with XRE-family HTH domain